ncbi:MAG: amidohydrolase, partial [Ignavibacterium sp.]
MKYLTILIIIFSSLILQAQEMKKAFINGKIYTVNDKQPLAEAVITEGNKIIFVGSTADAKKIIDSSTEVIDL